VIKQSESLAIAGAGNHGDVWKNCFLQDSGGKLGGERAGPCYKGKQKTHSLRGSGEKKEHFKKRGGGKKCKGKRVCFARSLPFAATEETERGRKENLGQGVYTAQVRE